MLLTRINVLVLGRVDVVRSFMEFEQSTEFS
jgi:hypothetical protein